MGCLLITTLTMRPETANRRREARINQALADVAGGTKNRVAKSTDFDRRLLHRKPSSVHYLTARSHSE